MAKIGNQYQELITLNGIFNIMNKKIIITSFHTLFFIIICNGKVPEVRLCGDDKCESE